MKAVILEDEQLAANRLKRMLKEVAEDIKVVATFESIQDTKDYLIKSDNIDILFLDIHVADGNSFELFDISEVRSHVIFTTAYDKYAIEAFRKNAVDYLLKPLKKDQLAEAIEKVSTLNKDVPFLPTGKYKQRIVVNFMSKLTSIKVDDIAYVYSKDKISYFYLNNGDKYASDFKMQDVEKMLNPRYFYRANRQFIIHIDALDQIKKHQASRLKITLNPSIDKEIVISTDKTPLFKAWLEK